MPQHGRADTLQLLNFAEFTFYEVRWIACRLGGARSTRLLLLLVLLR
jgi:hypothetical protein